MSIDVRKMTKKDVQIPLTEVKNFPGRRKGQHKGPQGKSTLMCSKYIGGQSGPNRGRETTNNRSKG